MITAFGIRNGLTVDFALTNSKAYHDKFEGLTTHKSVDEALYRQATEMLSHRSGSEYEDIAMLDARTGKLLMKNTAPTKTYNSGLTYEQHEKLISFGKPFEIIHNHPQSTEPSTDDIKALFERGKLAVASTVVGHNGSVYRIEKLAPFPNIKNLIDDIAKETKQDYYGAPEDIIEFRALNRLIEFLTKAQIISYQKR